MNLIFGMVVPALILSCLTACSLAIAAKAPASVRFWMAMAGLVAWVIPWPLIPSQATPVVNGIPFKITTITTELSDGVLTYAGEVSGLKGLPQYWLIGLFLPGLLWFGYDCLSYRRTVAAWRRTSRLDESLRQWLPEPLQNLKATIHVVCGSRVAAATGFLRPKVWIGDQFADDAGLHAALTHECCHVRRGDPLRLVWISFIRRVYFWNPIVAFFARQAGFLLEASCDQDCATLLGKEYYRTELARLILRAHEAPHLPHIVPNALTQSSNLQRVKLLATETRTGMRMYAALVLCAIGGLVSTAVALHGQTLGRGEGDKRNLEAVVVWRNGSAGDSSVWRTTGDRLEDSIRLSELWERLGDHLLIRKDARLYYVDDPTIVQQLIRSAREATRQTETIRRQRFEEAKAQMPSQIVERLRELNARQRAIMERLGEYPSYYKDGVKISGGFRTPDDASFEELDKVAQQTQAIHNEQEAKVMLKHPEWKEELDRVGTAWKLRLYDSADEAFKNGLAHTKP